MNEIQDLRTDFERFADETRTNFKDINQRFEQVDERFAQVDQRFTKVDTTLDILTGHMIKQQQAIDSLIKGQDTLNKNVLKLGLEFEKMRHDVKDALGMYDDQGKRITKLESAVERHDEDIFLLKKAA